MNNQIEQQITQFRKMATDDAETSWPIFAWANCS